MNYWFYENGLLTVNYDGTALWSCDGFGRHEIDDDPYLLLNECFQKHMNREECELKVVGRTSETAWFLAPHQELLLNTALAVLADRNVQYGVRLILKNGELVDYRITTRRYSQYSSESPDNVRIYEIEGVALRICLMMHDIDQFLIINS